MATAGAEGDWKCRNGRLLKIADNVATAMEDYTLDLRSPSNSGSHA